MKRAINVLVAAAVISLGITGALAVISHTHCEDGERAEHNSCPICQFIVQGFSATVPDPGGIITIFFLLYRPTAIKNLCARPSFHRFRSRAPPTPA